MRPRGRLALALSFLLLLPLFLLAPPLEAARHSKKSHVSKPKKQAKSKKQKKEKGKKTAPSRQKALVYQGPELPVYQGPPLPPKPVYFRAAGTCVGYEPGIYLLVSEIGGSGRVFKVDSETLLEFKPKRGSRVRIEYINGPDGPIAKRVLAGPGEADTTPTD